MRVLYSASIIKCKYCIVRVLYSADEWLEVVVSEKAGMIPQ